MAGAERRIHRQPDRHTIRAAARGVDLTGRQCLVVRPRGARAAGSQPVRVGASPEIHGGSVTDSVSVVSAARPGAGRSDRTHVLDTSVLLADPWALGRFAEHEVVIPLVVLTELEAKRHHPELGWAARETLRMLEDLRLEHGSLLRPMPANEQGGTLRVEVNHTEMAGFPAALTHDTNDHRILAVARNLASEGRDVVVVTKDLPLRLKASIVGLDADEYRNELAVDSSWNGVVELDVDSATIDTLFADHAVDVAEGRELPCNTGVVLHAGTQSALARVHDDKRVHLARSDRTLFDVRARSAEQRIAIDLLADPAVGIVSLGGPAGTGKSVLALAAGLEAVLEQRTHNRVIVFRPIFPVGGQDLGYLPGSESEKMMPWGAAVTDSFVVIDEAQNLERTVLLTALSRVGQGSRVVLTHDVAQRDNLRVGRHDGVVAVVEKLKGHPLFAHITLHRSERSPIAALVTEMLEDITV